MHVSSYMYVSMPHYAYACANLFQYQIYTYIKHLSSLDVSCKFRSDVCIGNNICKVVYAMQYMVCNVCREVYVMHVLVYKVMYV